MGEKGRRQQRQEEEGGRGGGARGGGRGRSAWREAMERGYAMNDRGRYEEAAECFENAIVLGGRGRADPHAFRGQALQDMGRIEEAMVHFDRAIELDPRHSMALFKKAEALLALNRVDEAHRWCRRAVKYGPEEAAPHHVMGLIHALRMDLEAAIAEFSESVRINPDNFRGYANMADPLIKTGRPKEALRCLDAALRINPEYAFAHCQRAVALNMLGRTGEAEKSWEKAVEHDPRYMLGDARQHLRADRQAELNRAGWRDGRPPKGVGEVRVPKGRAKARSEKGRKRDLTMARLRAACEMEGVSMRDAVRTMMSGGADPAGQVPIAERVREMKAGKKGGGAGRGRRGRAGRAQEGRRHDPERH